MKMYQEYMQTEYEWLGSIPSEWKWLYLSQTCIEQDIKNVDNSVSNVLSLSYGQIIRKKNIDFGLSPKDYATYQIVDEGNIILRLTDLQNDHKSLRTGLVRENGIITSAYVCLKPNENPAYLQYVLHSYDTQKYFYGLGGGVRQSIGYRDIRYLKVPLPPRAEQDQIVRYLDWRVSLINKLINAKRRQIVLLQEKKQEVINNAFIGGTEKWGSKPLKNFAKSNQRSLSSNTNPDFEFRYLDISSIGHGFVKQSPTIFCYYDAPSRARRIVQQGDTIISTVRTYLRSVCYIDHDIQHCIVSTGFSVLTPNKDIVLPELLSYALSSDYFVDDVVRNSIGVSYPAINDSKLSSLKVSLPQSLEEQTTLYDIIKTQFDLTDKALLKLRQQITAIHEYRNRLISDVVSGKIDVRGILIPECKTVNDVGKIDDGTFDENELLEDSE